MFACLSKYQIYWEIRFRTLFCVKYTFDSIQKNYLSDILINNKGISLQK